MATSLTSSSQDSRTAGVEIDTTPREERPPGRAGGLFESAGGPCGPPRARDLALQLQLVPNGAHARDLARQVGGAVLELDVRHRAHQRDHAVVRAHADAGALQLPVRVEAIADRLADLVVPRVR